VDFVYPDLPLPGALAFDPRVTHLELLANSNSKGNRNDSYIQGTFHSNFSIVLKPIRSFESTFEGSNIFNQSEPPVDINGVWTASDGGYVKIETNGDIFQAVEYPHPRSWGTVSGLLSGDTIYGVDFRSSVEFQDDRLDVRKIYIYNLSIILSIHLIIIILFNLTIRAWITTHGRPPKLRHKLKISYE